MRIFYIRRSDPDGVGQARTGSRRRSPLGRALLAAGFLAAAILIVGIPNEGLPVAWARANAGPTRPAMPNVSFPALSGPRWTLSQHRGHVVLLNFWATWCPPCREETPGLVKIAREYRSRGLDVTGVDMDQGAPADVRHAVQTFVAAYKIPYPILLPTPGSPLTASIQAFPTTILIDRQGHVARAYQGAVDEATFRADVTRLLAEPGAPRAPGKTIAPRRRTMGRAGASGRHL